MTIRTRLNWHGDAVNRQVRAAIKQGVGESLEHILSASNSLVPHDEGTLERSGDTDVKETISGVEGSVFYDTPYAVKMHEHPEYDFQGGRKGKYLESASRQQALTVSEFLRRSLGAIF